MKKRVRPFPHPSSLISHPSSERGVALILTLGILVLVTLLVIAFAVSMRVESVASKNFNDLYKARELAKGAIDNAVATIRQATTRGANVENYVTFPGVVYDYDTSTLPPTTKRVSLYSENAADITNLNSGLWITGNGEFNAAGTPDQSQFNVGWLYVAKDGTIGPVATLTAPIIGRFAYWVDDEASKINIDSAGQPTPAASIPVPGYGYSVSNEVDLSVLMSNLNTFLPLPPGTPPTPTDILGARSPNPYTTIEEIKRANNLITPAMFDANRFSMTTYSDDAYYPAYTTDPDVFDRQRKIISALNRGAPPTIAGDFDTTVGSGSAYDRLADAALKTVYGPTVTGTFADKYNATNPNGLKQIIANIIGYQINPTQPKNWPPSDATVPPSPTTPPGYLGLAQVPLINEVRITYNITGSAPSFTVTRTVGVELFYMYDATYVPYAPSGDQITVSGLPTTLGFNSTATITVPAGVFGTLEYRKCDGPLETAPTSLVSPNVANLPANTLQVIYTRPYFAVPPYPAGPHLLDFATMKISLEQISSVSAVTPVYQGAEVSGDPALNSEQLSQWVSNFGKVGGTYGAANNGYPPAGVDLSKVVMRGKSMQSIGELGFIHDPAVAWKHLKLQPGGGGGPIPDWAMLDLFTVDPALVPKPTMGRININSFINAGGSGNPIAKRLVPLTALLNSLSPGAPPAVDIYDDPASVRGGGVDSYGMKDPGLTADPIFDTIGEVCELTSLIPASATTEFDREATIRRIANLITVRSNTFTIWVMAQSIQQPPSGGMIFTGEVRAQAVVERYENPPGNPPKFRVRYFRYM